MKNEMILHSFQSVLPQNHLPQEEIVDWLLDSHIRSETFKQEIEDVTKFKKTLKRFTLSEKFINRRFFECNEVDLNWDDHEIYKLTKKSPQGVGIEERMRSFSKHVLRAFNEFYTNESPRHLIHVSCTGYISPSPAQVYFANKLERPDITHAYHMGCYASLPAVRIANALAMSEEFDIDIIHNELCSLHLNPSVHTPEQMVVQTLFADGHIKYSVGKKIGPGLVIKSIHEALVPDSQDDMTWIPSEFGMKMTLSREVPIKIRDSLPKFINEICDKSQLSVSTVLKEGIFAIHPGGPKIIEAVQRKLEISDEQVKHSKKVLIERGNMSSATLPHVWKEILDSKPHDGTPVLSLAFGPGLTIFGAVFEVKS